MEYYYMTYPFIGENYTIKDYDISLEILKEEYKKFSEEMNNQCHWTANHVFNSMLYNRLRFVNSKCLINCSRGNELEQLGFTTVSYLEDDEDKTSSNHKFIEEKIQLCCFYLDGIQCDTSYDIICNNDIFDESYTFGLAPCADNCGTRGWEYSNSKEYILRFIFSTFEGLVRKFGNYLNRDQDCYMVFAVPKELQEEIVDCFKRFTQYYCANCYLNFCEEDLESALSEHLKIFFHPISLPEQMSSSFFDMSADINKLAATYKIN